MTVEEIREVLTRASKLRIPQRRPNEASTIFVDRLGDYLLEVSYARADLEEARIHAYAAVELLEDDWDRVDGWEHVAGTSRPTQAQKDDAKATLNPDLWQSMKAGKRLVARLSDQIKRLGGLADDEAVSRAYTLFSGA